MSAKQFVRDKQYQDAIQTLTEAKKIADEHNWNEQYFDAVNQLAKSYYEMYNFNESLNMLLELYDFAEKNLPPEYSLKALNNMAVLYCEEEQYDKAVVSFRKSIITPKSITIPCCAVQQPSTCQKSTKSKAI